MPIQTTRPMLVLLFIILLAQFSAGISTVGQDSTQPSRYIREEDQLRHLSTISSRLLVSIFVSVSPVLRVSKEINGQENVKKDRWFMTFLALVSLDYVAWVGYSLRGCPDCEAAMFMIISSIFGAVVSCLWALIGLVRDIGCVAYQEDKVTLVGCFVAVGGAFGYESYCVESGYYALAGAVVAHLCRLMGTDYTRLSLPQFIVSLIGGLSGVLCIWHPDWAAAQPFWRSSAVIAGIRGLECLWWTVLFFLRSSPRPRLWLQKARVWIADAARA